MTDIKTVLPEPRDESVQDTAKAWQAKGWNDCRRAIEAAVLAASAPAQDAVDAKRWRELLLHVGGRLHHDLGQIFTVTYVRPIPGANIMRGGVAEHFTQAIDAALQASQSPQDQAAVKE